MKRNLLAVVSQWLDCLPSDAAIKVAYSGGRDSHVLLHALWQLRTNYPALPLSAIHINHGLQVLSDSWAKHCHQICEDYNISLRVIPLALKVPPGESVENVAREHRYGAFSTYLHEKDILVTAHTEDDQAETFMLQLLRGSGPLGLSGISPYKKLGKGAVARPLLAISRKEIAHYAIEHHLTFIEDPSNADTRFRRNFLRHEVLPKLEILSSGITRTIARSSQHCANTQSLLEEYLHQDLFSCLGETSNSLKLGVLKQYSRLKQEAVFRLWLKKQGFLSPSTKKLATILDQMLTAKRDASPCIIWGEWQVRRHKECLYLLPIETLAKLVKSSYWSLETPLILSKESIWQAKLVKGQGISVNKTKNHRLEVSFRQGGERCQPLGQTHSSPLKKILQRFDVPSFERKEVPLFYYDSVLVAVGDLFICEGWQAKSPEEMGWVIEKVD